MIPKIDVIRYPSAQQLRDLIRANDGAATVAIADCDGDFDIWRITERGRDVHGDRIAAAVDYGDLDCQIIVREWPPHSILLNY